MAIVGLIAAVAAFAIGTGDYRIGKCWEVGRLPKISPDYSGIRIPANIAPLNFVIGEPGSRYQVRITAGRDEIVVSSRDPGIRIPAARWRALLHDNPGAEVRIDVYVDSPRVGWKKFQPILDRISGDPVDPYLVYRDIYPQFYVKKYMSIKERSLEGFGERRIIDNREFPGGGCMNCHTFCNYRGDRFALQIRHQRTSYLLLSDRGKVSLIHMSHKGGAAFLSWHPSGNALAIAVGMDYTLFNLFSGMVPEQMLEFVDTEGDIGLYHIAENRLSTTPAISRPDRVETHPNWSPDGKYLYFVSARKVPLDRYREVRYDLRRIPYDIDTDTWGESETLVSADEVGMSCTFPRVSPDGRFLLFGMTDRSSLSLLRSATDLYLMELKGKTWRKLEINSGRSDSYHAWSSNGRWFCFVSKREDGVHGLVYFSHVDEDGKVSKPLVLPQSDPHFYETFLRTYNAPEFVREPVDAERFELGQKATEVERVITSK